MDFGDFFGSREFFCMNTEYIMKKHLMALQTDKIKMVCEGGFIAASNFFQ